MQEYLANGLVSMTIGGSFWKRGEIISLSLRGISDENISLLSGLMQVTATSTWVQRDIPYDLSITVRDTTIKVRSPISFCFGIHHYLIEAMATSRIC
jgi:hypothetical protein